MISRESAQVLGLLVCFCFLAWSYLQAETWWKERTASDREKRAEADMVKEPALLDTPDRQLLEALEQRQEELGIAVAVIHNLNDRLHPVTRTDSEREEDAKQVKVALQAFEEKYDATVVERDLPMLAAEVSILFRLVPDLATAEFIATALQCDVPTAVRAMGLSAENDAKGLP